MVLGLNQKRWIDLSHVRSGLRDRHDTDTKVLWRGIEAATEVLYLMSGRQYSGIGCHTMRPCGDTCDDSFAYIRTFTGQTGPHGGRYRPKIAGAGGFGTHNSFYTYPANTTGQWDECGCGGSTGCDFACCRAIRLLHDTRTRCITEVIVDGEPLSELDYELINGKYLIRCNGNWPTCQDLCECNYPNGSPPLQVTYEWGVPIPRMAKMAAAELAVQFILHELGDDSCRLPQNTRSLSRGGVSLNLENQTLTRTGGRYAPNAYTFNLPAVDSFLAATNPEGLRHPAEIASPDWPRGAVRRIGNLKRTRRR